MELRHLRYLVAVAEELNLRGPQSGSTSRSPLSQQIKQFEEEATSSCSNAPSDWCG